MKQIKIQFKNGEIINAELLTSLAPETCNAIWDLLPFKTTVRHSRWSGREFNTQISKIENLPERENQTIYTSVGEICYWREWLDHSHSPNQALAFYYGAELARSHRGDEPVNVFARVDYNKLDELKKIGERIWLEGEELIIIEKHNE